METIAGSGSYSFSRRPFFFAKVIHFNGNHCPQWKSLLLVEAIFFSGSHLFYQKLFVLVENGIFSRNYSFWCKPLFLVKTIGLQQYSFYLMETAPFNGEHFLQWKLFIFLESLCFSWKSLPQYFQWKMLLLIKTFPFSGSHSFQCFNIFVRRTYPQLCESLNINDSVRLSKMANLSCIHIPVEVFQSSETYLGPCQISGMKRFCENC